MATIVTLTGPTCAGKSHMERIMEKHGFGRAISTTTREPRAGEVDGVHYHFVSEDKFMLMSAAGEFAEVASFGKNWYGVTRAAIAKALEPTGKMVIVVEPQGAGQIIAFARSERIHVFPVWVDCTLEDQARRFAERIKAGMSEAEIASRLQTMLGVEVAWRDAAYRQGCIHLSLEKYSFYCHDAGPETTEGYVATILKCASS